MPADASLAARPGPYFARLYEVAAWTYHADNLARGSDFEPLDRHNYLAETFTDRAAAELWLLVYVDDQRPWGDGVTHIAYVPAGASLSDRCQVPGRVDGAVTVAVGEPWEFDGPGWPSRVHL